MEVGKETALDRESFVIVARGVKPKGLRGELVAELLTDFPERFAAISQFFAISPKGERTVVKLERFSLQRNRVVLKLEGYESIEAASTLVGHEFAVPESERVELAVDEFYDWELEGCRVVTVDGQTVGKVISIMRTGAANLLVVGDGEGESSLIPMVGSILLAIDKETKSITIDPPEGLLEL